VLHGSETLNQLATQVPGIEATLAADPSGMFQRIEEDAQIHASCFANNVTHNEQRSNWTSGLVGTSQAENNYWGDPSGPGGKGPGSGDQVGRRITFDPFLTEAPSYCDLSLAQGELLAAP
jgi:hypothetical protein